MKGILSTLILLQWFSVSYAQGNYNYAEAFFECNMIPHENLIVDSLNSEESGIWQIAHPVKSVINSSALGSSILLTDSVNSYPVSDSSRFYVRILEDGGLLFGHTFSFSGSYWMNTDSINDFVSAELFLPRNPELGWINLLEDSLPDGFSVMQSIDYYISWDNGKPTFTGNSNGWKSFSTNLVGLRNVENFDIQWFDTLTFRFTFHSDSVFDSLDGVGFDDMVFCNYVEGIEELNSNWFTLSPNPSSDQIIVAMDGQSNWELDYFILDVSGKRVQEGKLSQPHPKCDLSKLEKGVYYLKVDYEQGNQNGTKTIIKQ